MTPAIAAPYGSWDSPITADLIVANTVSLIGTALEGRDTYWLEMRPAEAGRTVLMHQRADGSVREVNAAPFSLRNRVHEYGGGSFVVHQQTVYFSNNDDQRLYRLTPGQEPWPLTPELPLRFADGQIDGRRDRWIGIREDHRVEPNPQNGAAASLPPEPTNAIVAVSLQGDANGGTILVSGDDFYASPRLSPDGTQLAWVSWSHPHMPWDRADLWVGTFQADGSLGDIRQVAGGPAEAVVEPKWSPGGQLYFVSDRGTGWWRFHRWTGSTVEAVCDANLEFQQQFADAEFGLPHWVFCMDLYAFASEDQIVCTYTQSGIWHLALVDTRSGSVEKVTSPYTEISDLQASPERAVFIAGSATGPTEVVQLDLATRKLTTLQSSSQLDLDPGYFSVPEQITFPTSDGQVAHGIYYPPTHPDYAAPRHPRHPRHERPPLLVKSHGGPTAAARSCMNLGIQYWTSRGFAVLDVNYRGSTGYGRAYREALRGQWGVVDVEDCVHGAKYLVARGDVDGDRLTINGGSAGGYTTLCALTFHDVFKAGASRYGISDLTALASDTHKFEARYLDGLVGPYPESEALYRARSPIHHADRLSCPIIFFQGLKDEVVPPNQAEQMVAVLKAKQLPVAYVPFPEEYHGFRQAESIKRSLDGELFFYAKVFGFALAQAVEPVAIENL